MIMNRKQWRSSQDLEKICKAFSAEYLPGGLELHADKGPSWSKWVPVPFRRVGVDLQTSCVCPPNDTRMIIKYLKHACPRWCSWRKWATRTLRKSLTHVWDGWYDGILCFEVCADNSWTPRGRPQYLWIAVAAYKEPDPLH